jgi:hypothetical protein
MGGVSEVGASTIFKVDREVCVEKNDWIDHAEGGKGRLLASNFPTISEPTQIAKNWFEDSLNQGR